MGQSSQRPAGDSPESLAATASFREQLDAAAVPCDGRGVVQENDTAAAEGTDVLLKAGPGLLQELGEAGRGGRRASGESAARTVSHLGRPRSATTARRVRTNSVVTLDAGDAVEQGNRVADGDRVADRGLERDEAAALARLGEPRRGVLRRPRRWRLVGVRRTGVRPREPDAARDLGG